jgi:hypothetical protein
MLMIVVTIIIAAVVSAFAGGLTSEQKKTPTAVVEFQIANGGQTYNTACSFKVVSVSEPIPTKDVKIIISWKARDGTTGGTTILPWSPDIVPNSHYVGTSKTTWWHSPIGFGPDINWGPATRKPEQNFGNYTFTSGVYYMPMLPYSIDGTNHYGYGTVTPYEFTYGGSGFGEGSVDGVTAFLGEGWTHLREGDKVNIKFIYIPTGGSILDQDVVVGRLDNI